MAHVKPISRNISPLRPALLDAVETIILLLVSIIFKDWDNFPQVIQNLEKYFGKTP